MPPPCTLFQYSQIKTLLEAKISAKTVGPLVKPAVSYTTVLKIRRNLKIWKQPICPPLIVRGRPSKMTCAMSNVLSNFLVEKPSLFIDEMVWFLYDEFDVLLSNDTVKRWLRKHKYTKKLVQRRAAERCRELRDHWFMRRAGWKANQLCLSMNLQQMNET